MKPGDIVSHHSHPFPMTLTSIHGSSWHCKFFSFIKSKHSNIFILHERAYPSHSLKLLTDEALDDLIEKNHKKPNEHLIKLDKQLRKEERFLFSERVCHLFAAGYSFYHIALRLNVSATKVVNAFCRVACAYDARKK